MKARIMPVERAPNEDSGIAKLKRIMVSGEFMYYSLSFDIGEYDDGAFWIQIYDQQKRLVFDEPFASSYGDISLSRILKTITDQLPFIQWAL